MKIAESSKSVSDTPETDKLLDDQHHDCVPYDDSVGQLADLAQKLERERDEARKRMLAVILERERWKIQAEEKWAMRRELEELLGVKSSSPSDEQFSKGIKALRQLIRERDEAREALADWENAADHVVVDHPDEVHCGCVQVLRKLLSDALRERDEAREAFAVATSQLVQAQEVLREISAADWKTSGELRGMAKRVLEGNK